MKEKWFLLPVKCKLGVITTSVDALEKEGFILQLNFVNVFLYSLTFAFYILGILKKINVSLGRS